MLLSFFACQSEKTTTKVPHVFADYFVRYLESERQLKAHAAFNEGDTLQNARPITFPRGVFVQGNGMEARHLQANTIRYTYNGTADYAKDGFIFNYEDLNNKNQQDTLQMAAVEGFSVQGTASLQGITLAIKSMPLQTNESLILLFFNEKNEAFSTEFKGPLDLTELTIPAAQLTGITPGKHSLYLVKKQNNLFKQNNINVTTAIEFYSKTIEIQIGR